MDDDSGENFNLGVMQHMNSKQKLELIWDGKEKRQCLESRILVEVPEKSYHAKEKGDNDIFDNMLIHGDNLLALKALEQDFTGKVKCIYIDPPYNTGSAFTHYDDCLEHSIWLGLMRERVSVLYNLLSEFGSMWINIDDDEGHYLKVLCDEIFGRDNFISTVIWQKKTSRSNDAKYFSDNHDFILVYAKNKEKWKIRKVTRGEEIPKGYSNPDNDPRGLWTSTGMSAKSGSESLLYKITTPSGRIVSPPKGRYWACSEETYKKWLNDNLIWFGKKGTSAPRKKTFLKDVQDGLVPLTVWLRTEVGDNQDAKHEIKAFQFDQVFDTPKPEKLIERILTLGSDPGDLVLDSFLGSGTTAAVAHKMGRRWIGIELCEHCYSLCLPRLQKVVNGEDQGGISKSRGWHGGGGFRFYELGGVMEEDSCENFNDGVM